MPFWKTSVKGGFASSEKKIKKEEEHIVPEGEGAAETINLPGAQEVITQVARQERGRETRVVETKQVITFDLDKEEYAAPILDLREILRTPEIIAVPGVPSFVKGIFNLRGQIVVVIDLVKRFALKREHPVEPRDIIIVEVGGAIFGVVVDEVTGVLRVPLTSIKPTPALVASKIHADYLNGVIVLEEPEGRVTEEELAPEQIEERLKTRKQAPPPKTLVIGLARGAPASSRLGRDESGQATATAGQARILLLLDLPKILSEEELLGFGNTVRQTVEEVK